MECKHPRGGMPNLYVSEHTSVNTEAVLQWLYAPDLAANIASSASIYLGKHICG